MRTTAGGGAPVVGLRWVAIGSVLLLSHCAITPRTTSLPPAIPWAERLVTLQGIARFELQGRIAASNDDQGFSAGLRWQQQPGHAMIDLSAPMGFGAAHIEQSAAGLRLTTSKGQTLADAAALDQLRATLGFDPPLASLRFWVLGASDPASTAQETLDPQQRLAHLEQNGWQIDYADYGWVQQQWLPQRLTATRDALRLRVVIEHWQL